MLFHGGTLKPVLTMNEPVRRGGRTCAIVVLLSPESPLRTLDDDFFEEQAAIAGFRHQGLVIDYLIGSEANTQSGLYRSAAASTRFLASDGAALLPGEYPVEALLATSSINYVGQVLNGGHGQYFGNVQCNPWEMDACENGLVAVGASDYLSIFRRARALIDTDPDRGYRIAAGLGFGEQDAEIRALDHELFQLHNALPLSARAESWLEALVSGGQLATRIMPFEAYRLAQTSFVQSHLECLRRRRIKEERRRSFQPGYAQRLYEELCARAGTAFSRSVSPMWRPLRMIHPEWPSRPELATGFETTSGDAYMFLLCDGPGNSKFRAALCRVGVSSPLAEIEMPEQTFRHFRQAMR
jgi:hypothetical protein